MAKTTAPLLSFGATGAIAKTQVYSSWRGIAYARRYAKPAYTDTTPQHNRRAVFKWLNAVWKLLDPNAQAPWTAFCSGKPLTARNAFIGKNSTPLYGTTGSYATDLDGFIGSPGANAGFPLDAMVPSDDSSHGINVAFTPPTLPSGWSVTAYQAIAIKQQAADTGTDYDSVFVTGATSPLNFAAIGAGTYIVSGWMKLQKPDGSTAYSPSITAAVTIA